MASAMPSSRWQISVTASVSSVPSSVKSGRTARARSTKSATADDAAPACTSSVGTGHALSARMLSASREVAITLTVAARPRIVSTIAAAASSTCSQLSITISRRRPAKAIAKLSLTVNPACGVTPRAVATAAGTAAGSPTGASSTSHTPSANCGVRSAATWSASRVLPTPPTPVNVTNRWVCIKSVSSLTSASRPMKLVAWAGRLPGTVSIVFSGGKSVRSPGARTWKICSASERSRSWRRPRSISSIPSRWSAVEAATRIWPPWPADITRAVRFKVGSK